MTREKNIICLFISRFCSYYFLFLSEVYNLCVPILWLVLALVRWVNIIPPLRFWNFQTWALSPRPLSKLHHAFAARVKKLFVQKKKHCWPHTVVTYSVYRQHYRFFFKVLQLNRKSKSFAELFKYSYVGRDLFANCPFKLWFKRFFFPPQENLECSLNLNSLRQKDFTFLKFLCSKR